MDAFCSLISSKQKFITPYTPQSSGLIERNQRTILNIIRKIAEQNPRDWKEHIPMVEIAMNSCISKSTGYSPYYLMNGRPFNNIDSMMYGHYANKDFTTTGQYLYDTYHNMKYIYRIVAKNLQTYHDNQKTAYDKKIVDLNIQAGDYVMLKKPKDTSSSLHKLTSPFTGPWKVMERLSDQNVKIEHTHTGQERIEHLLHIRPIPAQLMKNFKFKDLKERMEKLLQFKQQPELSMDIEQSTNTDKCYYTLYTNDTQNSPQIVLNERTPTKVKQTTNNEIEKTSIIPRSIPLNRHEITTENNTIPLITNTNDRTNDQSQANNTSNTQSTMNTDNIINNESHDESNNTQSANNDNITNNEPEDELNTQSANNENITDNESHDEPNNTETADNDDITNNESQNESNNIQSDNSHMTSEPNVENESDITDINSLSDHEIEYDDQDTDDLCDSSSQFHLSNLDTDQDNNKTPQVSQNEPISNDEPIQERLPPIIDDTPIIRTRYGRQVKPVQLFQHPHSNK